MTAEEYEETQGALVIQAQILGGLDLPGMLERIRIAEAAGPILDPRDSFESAKLTTGEFNEP